MKIIKGIPGAPGVAITHVLHLKKQEIEITQKGIGIEKELSIFKDNLLLVNDDLKLLVEKVKKTVGKEESEVFEAHAEILNDPQMAKEIKDEISSTTNSAAYAVQKIFSKYKSMFESMDDEYMKQRAIDIYDVSTRLLKSILKIKENNANNDLKNVVIVADELTPSDTVSLDTTKVKGMAIQKGGSTSHATIIARTIGIPAVVGLTGFCEKVNNGDMVIIDGNKGHIILHPTDVVLDEYKTIIEQELLEKTELKKYRNIDVKTKDGHSVHVKSNIGGTDDAKIGELNGMDGVGLFRTEFAFMHSSKWPTEEELFNNYKEIVLINPKNTVTFRTLDIGGDKVLPYYKFDHEDNPFLGERSIRFSLAKPEIFRAQLKAIIRAGYYGKIAIMFPMIATIDEFQKAKKIYNQCYDDLAKSKILIPNKKDIKIGLMIEIPVAAILTDQFAKIADFFSIGTNDLIQYSMAADRLSEKVRYLYQPKNPSILRLINMTIKNGAKEGIMVSVCGETASDPEMIPLLIGMGLKSFSVSPGAILKTKKIISELIQKDEENIVNKLMKY